MPRLAAARKTKWALLLMLSVIIWGALTTPAQASVPASYCKGRSYVSLVKTYTYGVKELRCAAARAVGGSCICRPAGMPPLTLRFN